MSGIVTTGICLQIIYGILKQFAYNTGKMWKCDWYDKVSVFHIFRRKKMLTNEINKTLPGRISAVFWAAVYTSSTDIFVSIAAFCL